MLLWEDEAPSLEQLRVADCLSVCLSVSPVRTTCCCGEDEAPSLEQLRVADNDQVLIEVRNKDQTWPEEMSTIANLSRAQAAKHRLGRYRTERRPPNTG